MKLHIRYLNRTTYQDTYHAMRHFTDTRQSTAVDEIWLTEHPPIFTQGLSGKPEHILNPGNIPVIQTDRGGQITYHGPGQLLFYVLIDLKRKMCSIRDLICHLEQSAILLLSQYNLSAQIKNDARGIYIGDTKIASLGLKVRRGCTYHGMSLNIAMDLQPFSRINPCGFPQLKMSQMSQFIPTITLLEVAENLVKHFANAMQYNHLEISI